MHSQYNFYSSVNYKNLNGNCEAQKASKNLKQIVDDIDKNMP